MRKALLPALVAVVLLAAAAVWAGLSVAPDPLRVEGPILRLRSGELVYRFHATFRVEALFDAIRDPYETRDLAAKRPEDLARVRGEFLKRLGLPSLEAVPSSGQRWKEMLEGNGYFAGGKSR